MEYKALTIERIGQKHKKTYHLSYVLNKKKGKSSKHAIVFLHGAGSNHTLYLPFMRALKNETTLAIDYPCHGHSDRAYVTIDEIAELLKKVLEKEQITKVTLVGNCLGATVAHAFYRKYPASVARMILFTVFSKRYIRGGTLYLPLAHVLYQIWRLVNSKRKQVCIDYQKYQNRSLAYYLYLDTKATSITNLWYLTYQLFAYDLKLSQIKVPTLVILATDDQFTRNTLVQSECAKNACIQVKSIKTNHVLLTQEQQKAIKIVTEYLNENTKP